MTHFIYSRVSTTQQNVEQQTKVLKEAYPQADNVFEDKASGNTLHREMLNALLTVIKTGDTIYTYDVSRIGRNTGEVLELIKTLQDKGVHLVIKTLDGLDITSPTGKLIITVMASVATMEREQMLEKQRIGIDTAKMLGKYKGKQADPVTAVKCEKVQNAVASKTVKLPEALKAFGVSRATYYRWKKSEL